MTRTRILLLLALLPAVASAQGSTTYLPAPGGPTDYTGNRITAHCAQDYRLYLPPAPLTPPSTGWPVLVHMSLSGFVTTVDFAEIAPNATSGDTVTQQLLALALQSGIAVVTARCTPSLPMGSPQWPADCGFPVAIPGQGLFHPPGHQPPDLAPGFAPYADPSWSMAEKDGVMLVQHVRSGARAASGPLSALDPDRLAVYGSSAGAITLMWTTLGPDRKGDFDPLWTGQYDEDTRPNAAILRFGATWFPVFCNGTNINHFGMNGAALVASQTWADVPAEIQVASSAIGYEDALANDALPTYMLYGDANSCIDYVPDPSQDQGAGLPSCIDETCFDCSGACEGNGQKHSAWSGYAWKGLHPTHTRLVLDNPAAFAMKPVAMDGELIEDSFEFQGDMVNWLLGVLVDPDDPPAGWTSPWTNLGQALAGVGGNVPQLAGTGTLLPDSLMTFTMHDGLPGAPAFLVLGVTRVDLPFKGGVLVPTPDVIVPTPPADADGWLWIPSVWPAGLPAGIPLYWQVWMKDPLAFPAWSATNAVQSLSQ